jgi:hypothetical protein
MLPSGGPGTLVAVVVAVDPVVVGLSVEVVVELVVVGPRLRGGFGAGGHTGQPADMAR